VQVSVPVQNKAVGASRAVGSAAVQSSADSLHDSEQFASPSGPARIAAMRRAAAAAAEVGAVAEDASSHAEPFASAAVQLSAASLHDSEQLPSPSGPGHGSPV
jgi:hypothetical protein